MYPRDRGRYPSDAAAFRRPRGVGVRRVPGGSGSTGTEEETYAIAVNDAEAAYMAGWTLAADCLTTVGRELTCAGLGDAFVAKVKAEGTGLVYAGYFGGPGRTPATALRWTRPGTRM